MPMKNPPHPARIVKASFDELGLTTAKAAEALGVSRNQMHLVLTEKSGISPEMAVRLEAVVGSTAATWLNMQAAFDLATIRNSDHNPAKGLKRIEAAPAQQANLL